MSEKAIKLRSIEHLHVRGDGLVLTGKDVEGASVEIEVPASIERQFVHLIADGLIAKRKPDFDPDAGDLLVEAELLPMTVERKLGQLGLEEKFVLQAQSEGSTQMIFRLSEDSAIRWADQLIAAVKKKRPIH